MFAGAVQNLAQRAPIDAVIVTEARVLGRDHRCERGRRDRLQRRINALIALAFDRAREHQRRDRARDGVKSIEANEEREKRKPRPDDSTREETDRRAPPGHL